MPTPTRSFLRLATAFLLTVPLSGSAQLVANNRPMPPERSASVLKKRILKDVLSDWERRYRVHFVYAGTWLEGQTAPWPDRRDLPLDEALRLLSGTGQVRIERFNGNVFGLFPAATPAASPSTGTAPPDTRTTRPAEVTVSGRVTDAQTGEALAGVSILLKGTTRGTTTNAEGRYTLAVPGPEAVLVVSYVGYVRQEVTVGSQTALNVALAPDTQALSEVVVVGYGTQKKTSLTSSVSEIRNDQITSRPVSNIQQSLQGVVPGVTVLDRGGAPGRSNATIRVRGITTISTSGTSDPLVIVDGVEQRLPDINPDDIESVSILKDASSTAIYGSRAANGVVLITTKRAKQGKITVDYNGYYAVQQAINDPNMMETEAYMRLQNVAYAAIGQTRYTEAQIQEYVTATDRIKYPHPNVWFDVLYRPAPQMNHTLALSGGGETFRGRMSLRYQDQVGIAPNFRNQINEIRVNTDFTPGRRVTLSADVNYRYGLSRTPVNDAIVYDRMLHGSLFAVPKYPNGTYGVSAQGHNPLLYAEAAGLSNLYRDYLVGSLKGDWEIVSGLKFSTQYAIRFNFDQFKNFANAYEVRDYTNPATIRRSVPINTLNEIRNILRESTLNSLLTYARTFGPHEVSALAGYSVIHNRTNNLTAYRENFYNNDVQSIGQGSRDNITNSGGDAEWALQSYFGRVNYAFAGRYLFEVNARYDGSSRFSEANRFSFFPSFSAGWRLSEEAFWKPLQPVVGELKLRGSWGKTGNQAVALYSYFPTLSPVNYTFNGLPVQGYAQSTVANQNLTWETTTQTDIGLDAQLFNNRLGLTLDWYRKLTDGILLELPIPGTVGQNAPPQNAGVLENKGWEVALNYRDKIGSFRYDLGANFTDNRNRVVSLAGTGPYITGSDIDPRYIIKEGLPVNTHWGYQTGGLFQSADEIARYPTLVPNTKPGDVKYLDRNGDGRINSDDMTAIGQSFPRYTFGLVSTFGWKNFDLFLQWQGAADVDVRLSGALAEMGNQEGFTHEIYTNNYWTPERTNARFPRPIKFDLRNRNTSDQMMIDGSYLRLKTLRLGYTLPKALIGKMGLSRANVYVSTTNLLTFSKLNEWNLDPEAESGRAQYYPQTALSTLGLNLQF